jgi:hypothetical protein
LPAAAAGSSRRESALDRSAGVRRNELEHEWQGGPAYVTAVGVEVLEMEVRPGVLGVFVLHEPRDVLAQGSEMLWQPADDHSLPVHPHRDGPSSGNDVQRVRTALIRSRFVVDEMKASWIALYRLQQTS